MAEILGTSDIVNIINNLTGIAQSSNSQAQYIAQKTLEYTNDLKANEINQAEFADLIADLKVDDMVASNANEMFVKEQLQSYTSQLVEFATLIVSSIK